MPIRIRILRKFFYRCWKFINFLWLIRSSASLSFICLDSGHRCHYFQYFGQHILDFLEITRFNWIRVRTRLRIGRPWMPIRIRQKWCRSYRLRIGRPLMPIRIRQKWYRSYRIRTRSKALDADPDPPKIMPDPDPQNWSEELKSAIFRLFPVWLKSCFQYFLKLLAVEKLWSVLTPVLRVRKFLGFLDPDLLVIMGTDLDPFLFKEK